MLKFAIALGGLGALGSNALAQLTSATAMDRFVEVAQAFGVKLDRGAYTCSAEDFGAGPSWKLEPKSGIPAFEAWLDPDGRLSRARNYSTKRPTSKTPPPHDQIVANAAELSRRLGISLDTLKLEPKPVTEGHGMIGFIQLTWGQVSDYPIFGERVIVRVVRSTGQPAELTHFPRPKIHPPVIKLTADQARENASRTAYDYRTEYPPQGQEAWKGVIEALRNAPIAELRYVSVWPEWREKGGFPRGVHRLAYSVSAEGCNAAIDAETGQNPELGLRASTPLARTRWAGS